MKKFFIAFIIIFLTVGVAKAEELQVETRMVGGLDALDDEFPWQLLLKNEAYWCGAVYVGNGYALTAAHCVYGQNSLKVYGGKANKEELLAGDGIEVTYVYHGGYDPESDSPNENDIAVLTLLSEVPSSIKPIQIASASERELAESQFYLEYNPGATAPGNLILSGWGYDAFYVAASELQYTLLAGVPFAICSELWEEAQDQIFADTFICAVSPDENLYRWAMNGDSGSPIIWQNPEHASDSDFGLRLVGLVCTGESGLPGVYTDVILLETFIAENTSELVDETPEFSVDPFQLDFSKAGVGVYDTESDGGCLSLFVLMLLGFIGIRRYSYNINF